MSIKIFCYAPTVGGYAGDPIDHFEIHIPYDIFLSTSVGATGGTIDLNIPFGDTAVDVFGDVYAALLAKCAELEIDTPSKNDIFAIVPISMGTMLPDLPQMS